MRFRWPWRAPKPVPTLDVKVADYEMYVAIMEAAQVVKRHGDGEVMVPILEAMSILHGRFVVTEAVAKSRWDAWKADNREWLRRKRCEQAESTGTC